MKDALIIKSQRSEAEHVATINATEKIVCMFLNQLGNIISTAMEIENKKLDLKREQTELEIAKINERRKEDGN